MSMNEIINDISALTEYCWNTGNFEAGCDCALCEHRNECSGSDASDYDEDDED